MTTIASPYISHYAAACHTSLSMQERGHFHTVILYDLKNSWNYSQSSRIWCVSFYVVFRIQKKNISQSWWQLMTRLTEEYNAYLETTVKEVVWLMYRGFDVEANTNWSCFCHLLLSIPCEKGTVLMDVSQLDGRQNTRMKWLNSLFENDDSHATSDIVMDNETWKYPCNSKTKCHMAVWIFAGVTPLMDVSTWCVERTWWLLFCELVLM
jgi:hypothetical protein